MSATECKATGLPHLPHDYASCTVFCVALGKNRPLDPEELAFMDKLLDDEAERERQKKEYEDRGLEEYRTVRNLPNCCPFATCLAEAGTLVQLVNLCCC